MYITCSLIISCKLTYFVYFCRCSKWVAEFQFIKIQDDLKQFVLVENNTVTEVSQDIIIAMTFKYLHTLRFIVYTSCTYINGSLNFLIMIDSTETFSY